MAMGRIYVLTSESQPGFVKIGKTLRTPEDRIKELDGTSLALPLAIAYELVTLEHDAVERKAHEILFACRKRTDREWFQCSPLLAIDAVKQAATETVGATVVGEIDYIGSKQIAANFAAAEVAARRQAAHSFDDENRQRLVQNSKRGAHLRSLLKK